MCLNGEMEEVLKYFFMQEKYVLKDQPLCSAVNYLFLEARQQIKVRILLLSMDVYYFSIICRE